MEIIIIVLAYTLIMFGIFVGLTFFDRRLNLENKIFPNLLISIFWPIVCTILIIGIPFRLIKKIIRTFTNYGIIGIETANKVTDSLTSPILSYGESFVRK